METFGDDHDNFVFKKRINSNKQSIIANKHKSRLNKRSRQQSNNNVPVAEPLPLTVDTTNLPVILNKCIICIYKDLNLIKLKTLAEGMGATVNSELTKSTTHLIIEPKGELRQMRVVNQAVSKGIICASPKWLLACYSERRFCPPTAYQYDIDDSTHTLDASMHESPSGSIFNPFNTSFVDYDALEKKKPLQGGQLRMDGFIHRTSTLAKEQSVEEDTQEEQVADEEFFYNSNDNITEEEKELKRLKSVQRSAEMEKALEQRRILLNEKNKIKNEVSSRKRRIVSNTYGERLKIWYGEQPFRPETINK